MSLNCTSAVQPTLRLNVGGMGKQWGVKYTKPYVFSIRPNNASPSSITTSNSHKARITIASCFSLILHIFGIRNITKIANLVIYFVSVNVVYYAFWPAAGYVKPSKSMLRISTSSNGNFPVIYVHCSSNASNLDFGGALDLPSEDSGILVVIKKFAQKFCGKIIASHDAVLSLIGQTPVRVISTDWRRHFNALET